MDRELAPETTFTREELAYLQTLLDGERTAWFNFKMELLDKDRDTEEVTAKYQLAKTCRDKVYHLGGRDTLALGEEYHQQRWWDQKHGY